MRETQQLAYQIVLDVSKILYRNLDFDAALEESLKAMSSHLRCRTAAYWRFVPETDELRCQAFFSSEACPDFEQVTRSMALKSGQGLPGRTCTDNAPVWVFDVINDLNFPRAEQAAKVGFHTAFAFPILSREKSIGVFEFFTHEKTKPDQDLLNAFVIIGAELGQFFERHRFERELEEQSRINEYAANIGSTVNKMEPLPVLLQQCAELTVKHLIAQQVEICVQNELSNKLDCVARSDGELEQSSGNPANSVVRIPLTWDNKFMGEVAIFAEKALSNHWLAAMPRIANNLALCIARKKAEDRLVMAERRFREFANTVDEVFFVSTPMLTTHFYVSEAYEKIWGLPVSTVYEKPDSWIDAIIPEHKERVRDYVRRLGDETLPETEIEYAITCPDGRVKWLSVRSFRIIDEHGIWFSCGTVRDVTDRKELETRLGDFYAMVSHELRTPLTSIKGAFILLERGKAGTLSERAQQIMALGQRECDRLMRLINDMLDIKRIEAGKLALYTESLDPAEVTRQTVEMLSGFAADRGIELEQKISACDNINADRDRVIQVITNFISNAVKFSPQGSTVLLETTQKDGVVRFSVTDQGGGISKANQKELFKVFQQVPYEDGGTRDGAGLGLAISKGIVVEHGGTIGVISDIGKGCTFWFELPTAQSRS